MADDKDKSLACVGHAIYELLDRLAISKSKLPDYFEGFQTLDLIINEGYRFKIWSKSSGLLIPGHGSLDYRVREAESLSTTFHSFLTDLQEDFEEVLALGLNETVQIEHVETKDNSEGDDETDDGDLLDVLLGSIKDVIDRLFRLAIQLRNPETRLRSSRAQKFQILNDGVDLFECFYEFELDYVSSLFRQFRRAPKSVHAAECMTPPDENSKTAVDDEESRYLVERIALANVGRRRQFAYWRQHHLKLGEHTKNAVAARKTSEPTKVASILPTPVGLAPMNAAPALTISTATQLLNPTRGFDDLASTISVSEYMPSSAGGYADVVIFPPPPSVAVYSRFFECPYCFTTCAKKTSTPKAWQAHLIHDLRPYICTYKDCRTPYQVYDTKVDWIQHETTSHVVRWKCPVHPDEALDDLVAFQLHTADGHLKNVAIEGRAQETVVANPMSDTGRSCPVCARSGLPAAQLNDHIAAHLERLAIFSLPRHVGTVEADDDVSGSDEAHAAKDSRGPDLRSDLSFESSPVSVSDELPSLKVHALSQLPSTLDNLMQSYLQQLAEKEEALGFDHPSTINIVSNLGNTYARQGKYLLAERMHLRAVAGYEKAYGLPSTIGSITDLGLAYVNQNKLAEAEETYLRALTAREKLNGFDDPSTLEVVSDLGKLHCDRGKIDEAVRDFERVLVGREKAFGEEHNKTFDAVNDLGAVYRAQGRFSDAKRIYEQALVMYEIRLGHNHQQALHMRNLLDSLPQEKNEMDKDTGVNKE